MIFRVRDGVCLTPGTYHNPMTEPEAPRLSDGDYLHVGTARDRYRVERIPACSQARQILDHYEEIINPAHTQN